MSLYSQCPPTLIRWILSKRPGLSESDLQQEDSTWLSSQVISGFNIIQRIPNYRNIQQNYRNIQPTALDVDSSRQIQLAALYCGLNPQYMPAEDTKYNVIYILLFIRKNGAVGLISQQLVDVANMTRTTNAINFILRHDFPAYAKLRMLIMLYKRQYPEWAPWFIHPRYYHNWLLNGRLPSGRDGFLTELITRINTWVESNAFMQIFSYIVINVPITGQQARGEIKYQTFLHYIQALAQFTGSRTFDISIRQERLMMNIFSQSDPQVCQTILQDAQIDLPSNTDPVFFLRQRYDITNSLPPNYQIPRSRPEYLPTRAMILAKKQILPWNFSEYEHIQWADLYQEAINNSNTFDDLLVVKDELRIKAESSNSISTRLANGVARALINQANNRMSTILNDVPLDQIAISNLKIILSATDDSTLSSNDELRVVIYASGVGSWSIFPRHDDISRETLLTLSHEDLLSRIRPLDDHRPTALQRAGDRLSLRRDTEDVLTPRQEPRVEYEIDLSNLRLEGEIPAEEFCCICQDNLEEQAYGQVLQLPCNHYFHEQCVDKWLHQPNANMTCPLCRFELAYN